MPSTKASCELQSLPSQLSSWIFGGARELVAIAKGTSKHAQTDKFHPHHYEHLYHAVLAPLALQAACGRLPTNPARPANTIRILEIGLGCGMPSGPGGGVRAYRNLLEVPPAIRLELHVMEFGGNCAKQWVASNSASNGACFAGGPNFPSVDMPCARASSSGGSRSAGGTNSGGESGALASGALASGRVVTNGSVTVHVGDQNRTSDLDYIYAAAGAEPFDLIVDDGSHHHEHQRTSVTHALSRGMVARGGAYIIEDLSSSCYNCSSAELDRPPEPAPQRSSSYPSYYPCSCPLLVVRHLLLSAPDSLCNSRPVCVCADVSMEPGAAIGRNGRQVAGRSVGGTSNCMQSISGRATMFADLFEWQRSLAHRNGHTCGGRCKERPLPFEGAGSPVARISIFEEAAALHLRP